MIVAFVAAAGIAILVWKANDANGNDPAATVGSAVPVVDLALLKSKAEAGDSEAAYMLARALVKGEQGLPNYSEAARLFQNAVEKGHVEAMVGLAELYTVGQGVTNNPVEALRLYLAAAQAGNVKAIYSLAGLYEEGRGVKKNQTLAAKWHQLAAERGLGVAQFNLGQRYELGLGVEADLSEAFTWLTLASKSGIEDAAEMIDRLRKKMTREQIADATRQVEKFSLVTIAPVVTNGLPQ